MRVEHANCNVAGAVQPDAAEGKYDDRVSSIRQKADDALNENESAAPDTETRRDHTGPEDTRPNR